MKRWLLAALLCSLTARTHAAVCSPTTFITADTYPASAPVQVLLADFNGDGSADIATASYNSATISVLLNNGDGTFAAPLVTTITEAVGQIAAADLRGNGTTDIVVAVYNGIEVLLGQGDGTFAAPVLYPSSSYNGFALVVARFDANDSPDVVLADRYGQELLFFPGIGNGTFGAATPISASNVVALASGDFNGDSKTDLLVSNGNAGTISLYPGNGDGTFAAPSAFVAGGSPAALAVADLDGDGALDIAATSGPYVSVLLGNGNGTFQAALLYPAGLQPFAIGVGDFDQDGVLDLATIDSGLRAVDILPGVGDGSFSAPTSYLVGSQASGMAVGDLDGDALPDIVSGNEVDAVVVLRNGGGGSFLAIPDSPVPSSPFQYNYSPQIAMGDWNGDGRTDLAWASGQFGNAIDVILSGGAGLFTQTGVLQADSEPQLFGVAAGDLDSDGKLDLVSADYSDVFVFAGNGDGTFATPRSIFNSFNLGIVAVADFTGDGKLDVLVSNCCGDSLFVLPGNGDGTFQPAVTTAISFGPSLFLPADLNGDGRVDLVESSGGAVYTQISNGDGTFQPPVLIASNGSCCFQYSFAVGRFTGGPLDLLVSAADTSVSLYPGNGDGTFGTPVLIALSTSAGPVTTGDYDADGHEDFAVFSSNQGVLVFPGLGNRHFQTPTLYPAGSSALALATGEFAGGALPDIAIVGQGNIATLVNARLGATVAPVSVLVGSPATLKAAASGFGPITYQWRRNGVPLVDGGSISGATTATLTIDPATFGDAGSYDVLVTDSCTSTASNAAALSVEFADVPTTNIFHDDIITVATAGITAGCGGANYCPTAIVTRAQMSVFLLKSEHGSSYVPPDCTGVFADVACPSPFADWIEQLATEQVTAGCGGNDYCPDNSVTRAQMAVFLLKTKQGSSYVPPPAAGIFGDVPPGSFAADWIEDLYNRGIAGGCSASPLLYCPNNPVNRGQMAAFLVNTFF